ncbi:MAG: hypothetical protein K9H26_02790 [Prolixibacteraceae bacterium]|nr:hypothetical protein [Prolixibacteraceae bacterium]
MYATKNDQLVEVLENSEVPEFLHSQLIALFRKYATISGMPEVVNQYSQHQINRQIPAI